MLHVNVGSLLEWDILLFIALIRRGVSYCAFLLQPFPWPLAEMFMSRDQFLTVSCWECVYIWPRANLCNVYWALSLWALISRIAKLMTRYRTYQIHVCIQCIQLCSVANIWFLFPGSGVWKTFMYISLYTKYIQSADCTYDCQLYRQHLPTLIQHILASYIASLHIKLFRNYYKWCYYWLPCSRKIETLWWSRHI